VGRASFGDQTLSKFQSIFRTFFGVDYLQQQLGLVCEFEESPGKLLFSDRKMEEENKSEAPVGK
jgi:hypothetical protein